MLVTIGELGNLSPGMKCISCGKEEEQKAEGRKQTAANGKEAGMAKELTEEQKEEKRAYQREWWRKNSDRMKAKRSGAPAAGNPGDCKRHPGVEAVIGKYGRNLGLCQDCLISRAMKAGKQSAKRFGKRALPARIPLTPAPESRLRHSTGQALSPKGRGRREEVLSPKGRGGKLIIERDGKEFIETAGLLDVVKEIRFEFTYTLTSAKVLKELKEAKP
jgi:hypothetical protein